MYYCKEHQEYYNEGDVFCKGCDKDEDLNEAKEQLLRCLEGAIDRIKEMERNHKEFYEEKEMNEIRAFIDKVKEKIDSAFALELTEAIVRKHGKL